MLALISAIVGGFVVLQFHGLLWGGVAALIGFALFVAFSYWRFTVIANDPGKREALERTGSPGRRENTLRLVVSALGPVTVAGLIALLL
ncbi:hypothetical protein SAMN05444722_2220 [Rhodovulum sp. ES.010]|uniref:hypothetical protein n=1 Tax=Rhodovulum sp. ES.010 TaxID=1882821 RepID=UPI000927118B|nr:hypothetical protein [Rhodovulum sp. ES.010]SIO44858.1 hypothetical protein SAMN05444722_2220 [Rhodovulum sp. ES.010]